MLKKKYRLRTFKDFKKVFARGRYTSNGAQEVIILKFLKNEEPQTRFAFIVANKVSKSAVKRNKIRRQLREIIRARLSFIKNGYDLVFIANPLIINKEFHEIKETVEKLLIKSKLWKL